MKTVYQIEYWHYLANEPFPGCAIENPNGNDVIGEYDTLEEAIKKCPSASVWRNSPKDRWTVEEYIISQYTVDDEGEEEYTEVYEALLSQKECDEINGVDEEEEEEEDDEDDE